jgi:hypothetical protein
MSDDSTTPAKADWAGVGDSFRTLGRHLSGKAKSAGGAISSATSEAEGAADQVGAAFKSAVDSLDATTTDPEVKAATRTATAKLLDAIKAELTGEPRSPKPPEPPKQLEPEAP